MIIFITGTSSGIGAALGLHYAKQGNTLCLLSRNVAAMEQTATACRAQGAQTIVYEGDVRDAKRMQEVGEAILKTVGTPDIVIANAGIRIEDPPSYVGCTAPLDIIMTNYIGVVNTFAPFIEPMTAKRAGHLVAITSIAAHRATPNSGIYSASKAAVNLWLEGLRLKLAPHNIHVMAASSGFVRTAMTADLPFHMPGILSAQAAATIIADATAQRKSRIMFPWQSRLIWSTFATMPGWFYDWVILFAKKHWPKRSD